MAASSKRNRAESPKPAAAAAYPGADAASVARQHGQQRRLELSAEGPLNPDTKDFCGVFAALNLDNSWDMGVFKKKFSIEIKEMSESVVCFDMVGIDPPLANAFRRILIAEVPTVAIGVVTIFQNTGVIHDENLAHRLGLIPLAVDPDLVEWRPNDGEQNEANCIKFYMKVECPQGSRKSVYSSDLKWEPWGDAQRERFADNSPKPIADDILIAQLASGQEIECECFCEKGIGKEHAKWSPVSTAFYRLLPDIELTKPIVGSDAQELKACCPMGVFDIEDVPGVGPSATVAHPRKCTTCRQCIESFDGRAKGLVLGKVKDHYIFTIESVGSVRADELFQKAVAKLRDKCETAKQVLASKVVPST